MKRIVSNACICALTAGLLCGYNFKVSAQPSSALVIKNGVLERADNASGEITIPSTVTQISDRAFACNKNITKVTIPASVKVIKEGTFSFCDNLQEVVISNGVEEIGDGAFEACGKLTKVNIPSSIRRIGIWSFDDCEKLTNVDFESKTDNIESSAFERTPWIESLRNENGLIILNNVLINAKNTKADFAIPDGIKVIGSGAFMDDNENIENVTIPDSVIAIKSYAFGGCKKIKSITIPDNVNSIADSAFDGCSSLQSISLGKNVSSIGHMAFYDCGSLKTVAIPSSLKKIELDSFDKGVVITGDKNAYNTAYKEAKRLMDQSFYVDAHRYPKGWNTTKEGIKFYINSKGGVQTGWMDLNGKRYYFYGNGKMATGFTDIGGVKYYFEPAAGSNIGNVITGWKKINNRWYYFNPAAEGNKPRGFMRTSWLYTGGCWYYLYSNGNMATGFINLHGSYYYLNNSGAMASGWKKINGRWYYFNKKADGGVYGLMRKGWTKIGGKWYYFYPSNGIMAANTWIGGYHINAGGAWDR